PALHVATDTTHCPHHVLDRVGAGERAAQRRWQFEAGDSQHLVEAFENTSGDTRRLLIEPAGGDAQKPRGFFVVSAFPSLSQRSADRSMQRLWQPLCHVASLQSRTLAR